MNQRQAKKLRKLAVFNPNAPREYKEILRAKDENGNVVRVQRVNVGARFVYQNMKKGNY